MNRAILSKRDLNGIDPVAIEYIGCVKDLIENEKILRLTDHYQHCNTSRLQHSLNVSYYSFLICRALGWNKEAAARGGLMHDLYYYDWRIKNNLRGSHPSWHPRVARDNARKICNLTPIEEDAILKHMWPLTIRLPRYKESYVVGFADKLCASMEFFRGNYILIRKKILSLAYPL